MNDNKKEKTDYFKLLETGFFWEFYPQLTGEWEKDKDEFIKNSDWLNQNFRNNMDAIGSKKYKIPTNIMNDFEKKFGKPKKLVNVKFEPLQEIKIEPKANLLPTANLPPWPELSTSKATPILVLYLNLSHAEKIDDFHVEYDNAKIQMEKFVKHGWTYMIIGINDGRDSFIESHSVERLDPIELKQLETKILESIKTGE